MDSQDYLDQISKAARPVKPKKGGILGILSSKYFKWGMVALGLLIVIMIFGSMLGNKQTMEEKCTGLKFHINRDIQVIDEYQPKVKSSILRSLSASFRSILSNTSSQLNNYMINTYKYDEGKVKEAVVLESDTIRDALLNDLFEAKINGYLDRMYAHKMTMEVYSIMSDEAGIINSTGEAELKSLLSSSYDSLNNLYAQFNDFSETTN